MKKQLPKIAIKYSEENWPEIKKAVDLLRSKGFSVERRKCVDSIGEREFIGNFSDEPSLSNQCFRYFYSLGGEDDEYTVLTMPSDFEKLKSYFDEEQEPKRGEVVVFENGHNGSDLAIIRVEKFNEKECDYISRFRNIFGIKKSYMTLGIKHRKATPEEEAKLIKAEHDNGFHWDGKELIKIPEYVEVIKCINPKHWYKNHIGDIFKVFGVSKFMDGWSFETTELGHKGIIIECCKPSTREAFEAQNTPKLEAKKWYYGEFNGSPHFSLYMGENWGVGFYKEDGEFIWCSNIAMGTPSKWKPADMNKVKELLTGEAERRGFKDGVKVISTLDGFDYDIQRSNAFALSEEGLRLDGVLIFSFETGKWAEIIEEKEQFGESPVSKLIKDDFDVNKPFFGLKPSDNFFNEIKEFSAELLSTIGNINGHNSIPNCRCCLIPEQYKTPSEAINSPKRLAKQVEKLERRVIELKEENKRLKSQLQTIAQQPEIIEQVKKMITE